MHQGVTPTQAVRLALENLREANTQDIAKYVKEKFGLTLKPPIVSVLLGSLQERERLSQRGQVVREEIERWKAENPEEAKKLAAQAKRREAAKRRKQGEPPAEG